MGPFFSNHPVVERRNNKNEKCKHCHESIKSNKHVKYCKLFSKHFKKTSEGYECKLCPTIKTEINKIYGHLRETHKIGKISHQNQHKKQSFTSVSDDSVNKTDKEKDIRFESPVKQINSPIKNVKVSNESKTDSILGTLKETLDLLTKNKKKCTKSPNKLLDSPQKSEISSDLLESLKEQIQKFQKEIITKEIKTEIKKEIPDSHAEKTYEDYTPQNCKHCHRIISKHEYAKHAELCQKASKCIRHGLLYFLWIHQLLQKFKDAIF